jgi:hypothetical protein
VLGVALCAVVFADLARANRDALYAPRPEVILEPPPVAHAILADHAARRAALAAGDDGARPDAAAGAAPRVFSNPRGRPIPRSLPAAVALDRNLPWGAVGELYGLANVNAPSSLNLVKHEWLQELLGAVPRATALGALAALGTRYVTSWVRIDDVPGAIALPVPGERIGVKLYALADAQPRAFVARRVVEARGARDALERFVSGEGGGHTGLALVDVGALPAAALAADAGSAPGAAPRIVVDAAHRLEIAVEVARPSLLVVNDTMLAGWSALVDGGPAPLVEVNGLVRGVWLPAPGVHRVTMRYVPPGLAAGGAISLAALLVALGAAWYARRRLPRELPAEAGEPVLAGAGR